METQKQLNELKEKLESALSDLQEIRINTSGLGGIETELKCLIISLKEKIEINECVHCTTNEEYLFVISKFNPKGLSENLFETHSNICIYTLYEEIDNVGKWDFIFSVDKETIKILTFSEWCKKYNHEEPKYNQGFLVGDYSDKPLILEVSMDKDFKNNYIQKITEVDELWFCRGGLGMAWRYARKIDLNKYQI